VRGASAPVLGPKPWSPSTFQPWLRPCIRRVSVGNALTVESLDGKVKEMQGEKGTRFHTTSSPGKEA